MPSDCSHRKLLFMNLLWLMVIWLLCTFFRRRSNITLYEIPTNRFSCIFLPFSSIFHFVHFFSSSWDVLANSVLSIYKQAPNISALVLSTAWYQQLISTKMKKLMLCQWYINNHVVFSSSLGFHHSVSHRFYSFFLHFTLFVNLLHSIFIGTRIELVWLCSFSIIFSTIAIESFLCKKKSDSSFHFKREPFSTVWHEFESIGFDSYKVLHLTDRYEHKNEQESIHRVCIKSKENKQVNWNAHETERGVGERDREKFAKRETANTETT